MRKTKSISVNNGYVFFDSDIMLGTDYRALCKPREVAPAKISKNIFFDIESMHFYSLFKNESGYIPLGTVVYSECDISKFTFDYYSTADKNFEHWINNDVMQSKGVAKNLICLYDTNKDSYQGNLQDKLVFVNVVGICPDDLYYDGMHNAYSLYVNDVVSGSYIDTIEIFNRNEQRKGAEFLEGSDIDELYIVKTAEQVVSRAKLINEIVQVYENNQNLSEFENIFLQNLQHNTHTLLDKWTFGKVYEENQGILKRKPQSLIEHILQCEQFEKKQKLKQDKRGKTMELEK